MNTTLKSHLIKAWILIGIFVIVTAVAMIETPELPSTNKQTFQVVRIGEMSVLRAAHRATRLNSGEVLITGGAGPVAATSAESYDPETQTFRPVASMAAGRCCHGAALLPDGRVLVTGGLERPSKSARDRVYASAEIYDPVKDRWTAVGKMTEPRYSHFAIPLPNGRVLLAGGWSKDFTPLASAEVFDPATSTFSKTGSMQVPRAAHVAVALADGRVLVAGGRSTGGGPPLRSAEIYNPTTGEFHPTSNMSVPRLKHAAALLPDGKVLIIGGNDGSAAEDFAGRYKSTEIYNPETGTFSPGPDMHRPRFKIRDAVAVLPSGKVVIGGGFSRLEVYDPAKQAFVWVKGKLNDEPDHPLQLQAFNTATLLPTGDVLVLGGSASAWLVQPVN